MANAYAAGAAGLPMAVFRGYAGVQLPEVNPNIKFVDCPFTGEKLACVPSIRADVGIIHAQRANRNGDILLEGIVGVQKEVALASKRTIVTVEEIVEDLHAGSPNAVIVPNWAIDAIVEVPNGASPSYTHGYYKRNNAFYIEWAEISREREVFLAWMEENVLNTK
jgi:glutaconate CoA-transferase subunit A